MLSSRDIQSLLTKGEHLTLECKRCANKLPNSLWDTYSAFANSYGGYILLGIEEHREEKDPSKRYSIEGVTNPDKLISDFWNLANDSNKVSVNVLSDDDVQVIDMDGKEVIAIYVPRADYHLRPIYINDNPARGSFRRKHEGDYHCAKEEISSMYRDASDDGNDSLFLEYYTMDDVDAESLRGYRQMFIARNPDHWLVKKDDKEFLMQLGGYIVNRQTGEEGLTMAGLLMFGKGLPIRQRFSNIRLDYVDKSHLSGEMRYSDRLTYDLLWENNLFQFIALAMPRLTRDLPRPFELEGMQRNDDTPLHKLVREAFTNMIIHADFMATGVLRAEKRDDGFYFSNPGVVKLPIESVYHGGLSRARNPHMQNMLRMIGYGENLGTGFPTMVETWENKFHTTPQLTENLQINITELTFSGMNFNVQAESKSSLTGTDVVDRVVDKHKIQLTERQQVIIKIIHRFVVDHVVEGVVEDGVEIPTARSIAKQLETSPRTIQRELAYLQSQNIIIRRGNDYGGYWEIIE